MRFRAGWRPFTSPVAGLAAVLLVAGLAAGSTSRPSPDDATVERQVWEEVAAGGTATFWVYLRERADLSGVVATADRVARGRWVYEELTGTAAASQAGLVGMLAGEGVVSEAFWIANVVRVTGDAGLVERVAARPEVARVTADRVYTLPEPAPEAEAVAPEATGEWNLDDIRAPRVWDTFGLTGEDIVVGSIDTGVQFDHPALVNQYRGNLGGGGFDHDYSWHDPSRVCGSPSLVPCDNNGHGTHTTGTMVGDDGGGNRIGVAPGARWIAAKGCEGQTCSQSALLSSGQFMLAPTDLRGENPDPARRPHVVNNSWGGEADADPWYRETVRSWVAAGIFPQFSAGNTVPGAAPCGSASNPGNLSESHAAGAYDRDHAIAAFSNRGPSAFGGVKPNLAAPGVDVRSSLPGDAYGPADGTSMASPHVAGTVALMWSAAPALAREVDATRELLDRTAVDTEDLTCGGTPGNNNVWGEGRLDAFAAVEESPRGPTGVLAGTVTDASDGSPIAGATVTISGPVERERRTGADGAYAARLPAGEYTVSAAAFGYTGQTAGATVDADATTGRDFDLEPVERVTVSGRVTDGSGHGWPLYARVDAAGTPVHAFTDPVTGDYRLDLPAGDEYELTFAPRYPGYAGTTETVGLDDADVTRDVAVPVDRCDLAPGYAPSCVPTAGGLVLGQVTDENTGGGVAGATVTSTGDPAGTGQSAATPDDPAVGDGFYWLFSSLTGNVELTATARGYAGGGRAVTVAADAANEADVALAAGRLAVAPAAVAAELPFGRSASRTVTVTNIGTAPAELAFGERRDTFETLAGGPSWPGEGEPWQAPAGLVVNPDYDPDSPTTEGQYLAGPAPATVPASPGTVIRSWRPAGLALAWGVGHDDTVWLSDIPTSNHNHEFAVDGSATGTRHPTPWAGSWPADMTDLSATEMCQVNVGGDNGIQCWHKRTGEVTRALAGAFPWTVTSQRGLAHRGGDDTFYIGGWNQDILYQVGGFDHGSPGEVVHQCAFPGMGISGLAWNPTAELLWVATNSATDAIFLVDPDECTVLGSLAHPTPGGGGGGLHLDQNGDLWMVSLASAGAENRVYLVETGLPHAPDVDVPWLAHEPRAATLRPGESVTVTVTVDSGVGEVTQPGTYTAGVAIRHDTPYQVPPVGVRMVVAAPNTWGKVTGIVTRIGCGGQETPVAGATVQLTGGSTRVALPTGPDGRFAHWLPVADNPLTLIAWVDGQVPQARRTQVLPGRERVEDFSLSATGCLPDGRARPA